MVAGENWLPLLVLRPLQTQHGKYASWPYISKSNNNNKKKITQGAFCNKSTRWIPGYLRKGHSSLGELHWLMGWGPAFSLIRVLFLWKKRSWRFRERAEVPLCGSKNADWDVTDPAIQLHGDWFGRHLPQGADWAFLGSKLLCQINFICCLNNARVLNCGKNQNGNSGWRGYNVSGVWVMRGSQESTRK